MNKKLLDQVAILPKAHKYLTKILHENPRLRTILDESDTAEKATKLIEKWALEIIHKFNK